MVDVGVYTFAGEKPAYGGVNPLDLPLFPLASLFSTFLLESQAHTNVLKLFHIKNHVFAIAKAFQNLHVFPFCKKL